MTLAKRIAALCLLLSVGCLGVSATAEPATAEPATAETVSVLYFANTAKAPEYDWLSKGLADMLISDLAAAKELSLVEREELEKVLREQEFQFSGLSSDADAVGLGKLLKAKKLVYGGFIVIDGSIRIDSKAVDAETGKITGAASVSGKLERALELERELSGKLLAIFGVKAPAASARTESLAAAKSYYSGLMLYDSGDYERAIELFKASAAADPSYPKPQKGIQASYSFLKDFKRTRQQGEMSDLSEDIARLEARLSAPRFFSYADMIADPVASGYADAAEAGAAYQSHPRAFYGDTPVQAIVGLEDLYRELGDLAWEYFEDGALMDSCYARQLALGRLADAKFPEDPFLPEALYRELFSLERSKDWDGLKALCERLMLQYPKYRMIWAVEGFYERTLGKIDEGPGVD